VNIFIILAALLVFPREAHAYLDPGSGSYFFQLILGVVFGSLLSIKIFWKKVKMYLEKLFK